MKKSLFIMFILLVLTFTATYAEQIDRAVVGCKTEKHLIQILKVIENGDYDKYQNLLYDGNCSILEPGTRVSIIKTGRYTVAGNTIRVLVEKQKITIWTLEKTVK